jgi:hypothetical protein
LYRQLARTDKACIYEQHLNGEHIAWEVFKIRIRKADKLVSEPLERFPGNEDFGKWAWSYGIYSDYEKGYQRAMSRYNEIA